MTYVWRSSRSVIIGVVFLVARGTLAGQQRSADTLVTPVAVFAQGFTRIASVRELRDGRVILLDSDERGVYLVSSDLMSGSPIGRSGSGPGEYRLPSRLLDLRGDTTAVLDAANARLLLIRPDGTPGDIVNLQYAAPGSKSVPPPPVASDGAGRLYAQASPVIDRGGGRRELTDSAAVLRWQPGSAPDTAGLMGVDVSRYRMNGGLVASTPLLPFSADTHWAVASDGRLAIVYAEPYHVVMYSTGGSPRIGAAIDHRPIRLSAKHKEAYRREAEKPRPWLVGRIGGAPPSVAMIRQPFKEPAQWPEFLPPFLNGAFVQFAPDGYLWVERASSSPEDPPCFDILDDSGRRTHEVRLPVGTRVVGFGKESVYLVRWDEVDLEYLERYKRPRVGH